MAFKNLADFENLDPEHNDDIDDDNVLEDISPGVRTACTEDLDVGFANESPKSFRNRSISP